MEAREFKIDINQQEPVQLSQEEQRLKAIKKILVGNQIERLENRFRGLSRRVESTNGHLVATVDDLNNELQKLKTEMQQRGNNSQPIGEELQKGMQELLNARKDFNLVDPAICNQLEERINTLEEDLKASNPLHAESKAQINAMSEDIKIFKDKLQATQEKLSRLDREARPEDKAKVDARLSSLEAKIKSLNPKRLEQKLTQRQDAFEDGVQDLVERLAGRVNERFDFASNSRKKLADNQEHLAQKQVELKQEQAELGKQQNQLQSRVNSIQDILENDIINFLQNNPGGSGISDSQVKQLASDMERKIYENNIRLEAKMDALFDMTQRQLAAKQAPQEDPKLQAIKGTLKQLSQLLDE
ncbi:coiled-coil domain-containing protein [Croceimicrobium hydrocarbonivorans]|uniref:Uncharacterized protein n=1 Tax=Croceimicrobium hydrocarbonivorans TaxID=2761580 RepID=A0A7H0VDS7_9FLAO|nr:hypothetical protein [Croceimicrobium hydrocarbonivorans]QNR23875.1 hypothetical protein H4K34_16085 [Croceimicrobium hydrocarbonivorans]